jgi:hypothetical protein
MEQLPTIRSCTVCGGAKLGSLPICAACEEAFKSADADPENASGIDLDRYTTKMFPWEPSDVAPRLLSGPQVWPAICVGLVLIVVVLSLLRTPIPTCWETSM